MSSDAERWACDTSVAVAALDATHVAHATSRKVVVAYRPALAGHAAFETYAVLTRLPMPLRLSGRQAASVLRAAFPDDCWLAAEAMRTLLDQLPGDDVVGGSVYDALVGEAARTNGRTLLTRDRRAEHTYRALGLVYELVT